MSQNEDLANVKVDIDAIDTPKERKRSPNKDRSAHEISADAFKVLSHEKKYEMAKMYLLMSPDEFDATHQFRFSHSHFEDMCKKDGIVKETVIVDHNQEHRPDVHYIYIDHDEREDTIQVRNRLSPSTKEMYDQFLMPVLGAKTRAKIVDAILAEKLTELILERENGALEVQYRPRENNRVM